MKWTDAQREAIELREKNILVSAAAGSGKTAVLVERIKKLLLEDGVSLEEMLIVTFSNAAASEMREKIVKALSREIAEGNPKTEEFARRQLVTVHRANISTFHSFAMEVIKRYFHLIEREPGFKICDEAQKSILQARAMERMFQNLFEAGDEAFLWFLSEYSGAKNENDAKDMITAAHQFIQSIPDSYGWLRAVTEELKEKGDAFYGGKLMAQIKKSIGSEIFKAKNCFSSAGEILEQNGLTGLYNKWKLEMEEITDLEEMFDKPAPTMEEYQKVLDILPQVKFQTYRATAAEKETYEEVKPEVAAFRDEGKAAIKAIVSGYAAKPLADYIEDLNATYKGASSLSRLVTEFDRLYRLEKDARSLIDFSDIEHFALDILSHEEAAAEYREKFRYIFIDEYQDSNLVQETLIGRIKRENNLFMVGDVKQSIYKFRLAEPEIFIEKYERYRKESDLRNRVIDLNRNFRSKGSVIEGVNHVFSRIMTKEMTGLSYDDAAALYKGVTYEGELDYPIEIHLADDEINPDDALDEEIADMKKMEVEAYHAAKIIKEAVGKQYFDVKSNSVKNLQLRDMVILLRGVKGTADIFTEALSNEGIPSFADTGDGYFDTLEIEIFLNLLRVIENYKQDIPLISVLKSPIFDFSLEELIKIRLENRNMPYQRAFTGYGDEGTDEALRVKCGAALEKLCGWSKEAVYMTLPDFLWKLMRETGYASYISALPGGMQRQANLRALVDKAVQFQSSQGKGLFQFILYIEAVKKEKITMGQIKLLGEKDDVVRIMTVHKSKGLEFPLVLVAGLGKKLQGGSKKSPVLFHKDLGLGLRVMDRERGCYKRTILQTAITEKKKREEIAEDIRVLYVAFTRAMDRLILLGTPSSGMSYLSFLMPILDETKISVVHHSRREVQRDSITREDRLARLEKILKIEPERDSVLYTAINDRLDKGQVLHLKNQNLSGRSTTKTKYSVSELSRVMNDGNAGRGSGHDFELPKLKMPLFKEKSADFTAAEKGTMLHTFMEHLNFKAAIGEGQLEYLENFKKELVKKEILLPQEAEVIDVEKAAGFLLSQIGRRAAQAEKIYKEVSFNLMTEYEGKSIMVQGTIDCYFEEGDDLVLLDYKSNYLKNSDDDNGIAKLTEAYRGQIHIYREALTKIKGKRVKEAYLYLFGIDREILI